MSYTQQISSGWSSLLAYELISMQTTPSFMVTVVHLPQPSCRLEFLQAIDSIHAWMSSNRLSLNTRKTQFIWFGTRAGPSQTRYAPTLQSISFPGRTYHRQESRLHTWSGTLHEGPRFKASVSRATISCAKFVQSGIHCHHQPFVLWCMLSSAHVSTSPTVFSTGRVRISLIVYSRSWIPQRAWFWQLGNTNRSQLQFRRDLHWLPIQARILIQVERHHKKLPCGSGPSILDRALSLSSTRSRRGATYVRQHKSSSWSLVSVRSALVVVVSPSHHRNCGTYFQLTFDSYTRSHNSSKRDSKLIVCSSPFFTTEDLCLQCDIYYYYYY